MKMVNHGFETPAFLFEFYNPESLESAALSATMVTSLCNWRIEAGTEGVIGP